MLIRLEAKRRLKAKTSISKNFQNFFFTKTPLFSLTLISFEMGKNNPPDCSGGKRNPTEDKPFHA